VFPQGRVPGLNLATLLNSVKALLRAPVTWLGELFGGAKQAALVPLLIHVEELQTETHPPAGQVWKNYILVGGQRVAMREYTSTSSTVYFLLGDHLGSVSVVTDAATGAVVGQIRYSAYGEERYTSGMTPTDYRYTGQLSRLAEIGLYHYGARWFDPEIAHFVQADTIVPGTGNPLAWDRYLYTLGNPIIYNDPIGHDVGCGGRDASQCVSYGKVNSTVIRRQILDKHNQLVSLIRQGRISDLIGFSQLVEFAASYTPYNARDFTQNAGAVLTGHASGHAAGNEVRIQIQNHMAERGVLFDLNAEYTPEYLSIASQGELMQSGYDSTFQDPGAGGNQAHHYWFFVQVGYESSFPVGVVGSALHSFHKS